MKEIRHIFYILLAILAISCKKEPKFVATPKIEFYPTVATKSYITSAQDPAFQKGFSVFANKTEINDYLDSRQLPQSIEIMENYHVHYKNGVWTYSPLPDVYWGPNCHHEFLAIYPYSPNAYTFREEVCHIPGIRTIQESGNVGYHTGEDILYGRQQQDYMIGDKPAPIVLNMKHALSALSIRIRNASGNDIEYIDNIRISGLYTEATGLQIPRDIKQDPIVELDRNSIGTYLYPPKQGSPQSPYISKDQTHFQDLTGPEIILPQKFLNLDVALQMHIHFKDHVQKLSHKISQIPLPGGVKNQYSYLPGKHYIYRIDILNNYIICSVNIVNWIEDTPIDLL